MRLTLTLPDALEAPLRRAAAAQGRTAEGVALDILREALLDAPRGDEPDLATVVAAIRALPRDPQPIRPGCGSPRRLSRGQEHRRAVRSRGLEADRAVVEAEIAARERADDRAEGRA